MRIRPLVVREDGIVEVSAATEGRPGIEVEVVTRLIAVVIAVVVMPVVRADEQVHEQRSRVDDDRRRVDEVRLLINRLLKRHRREHHAAIEECEVPESRHEDAAVRRPDVLIGNPDPVGHRRRPIAGPPLVIRRLPCPAAGNPEVISFRSLDVRSLFKRSRRFRQVGDLLGLVARPEARDPLESTRVFGPVARHPASIAWNIAPQPADPQKLLAVGIPAPVPRNPGDVLALRHLLGRNLVDRFGRLLVDHHSRLGIRHIGIREGLVHGAASQGLVAFGFIPRGRRISAGRGREILGRQAERRHA